MRNDTLVRLDFKNRAILHDRVVVGQVYSIQVDEDGVVTLRLKDEQ